MNALRQFLGGLVGGAIVVALVAGGLLMSAGDVNVAFRPPSSVATPSATAEPPTQQPPTETSIPTPSRTPTLVPTGACPRPAGWIDHVAAAGETLQTIAQQFNIDPVLLQVNNCLIEATVEPGQVVFVPPLPTDTPTATWTLAPSSTPACGPPPGWPIYIVRPGDTLSSIARATGASVAALMQANCLASDRIRVGQALFVPRLPQPPPTIAFTPTRTPTPSVTPTGSWTPTPSFTPTPSLTPSSSVAPPTITATATPSPTATPTPTDTSTPIVVQSPTPSPTVDASPSATGTSQPTLPPPSATPSPSATP